MVACSVVPVVLALVALYVYYSLLNLSQHDDEHAHNHGHSHTHTDQHEEHSHNHSHNHSHSHSHSHNHSHSHSDSHHSHNMRGVFLHILADTMGSVGVVISTLMIQYWGWTGFDPIASLLWVLMCLKESL